MTKAILIDPFNRSVTAIEKGDGLQPLYDALSEPGKHRVFVFDAARLGDGVHFVYFDDEGALRKGVPTFAFVGGTTPIFGKALIVASDDEGNDADVKLNIEVVRQRVVWLDLESTGEIGPSGPVPPPPGFDFAYKVGTPVLKDRDED